jgi:aminoglycoside phosphotransferase (APT) family kinase protein
VPVAAARLREAAHRRIDDLPDGSAICHGDYHTANVVLADGGPAVIDWVTAAAGPPEADVARTLFLVRDSGLPPELPLGRRMRIVALRHTFSVAYGRAYRERRALDPAAVRGWRLPILVARLAEGIDHERGRLLRTIERDMGES